MKKTIINYANGDKYEGGLKGKRKHGYGIFTWAEVQFSKVIGKMTKNTDMLHS